MPHFSYPLFFRRLAATGLALSLLAGCAAPSRQVRATRQGRATAATEPQMVRSTEATEAQLNLAHRQGYAQDLAVRWYLTHAAPAAHQQPAGEYLVAYALAAPEGWYAPAGGSESGNGGGGGDSLTWHPPAAAATAHLRVFVRDAADGRALPGLTVRAEFTAAGQPAGPAQALPYGWYPLLAGYGENLALPPGRYHLRLTISALPFRRQDPYNGDRLSHQVVAEFDQVPVAAELARAAPLSAAAARQTDLVQAQGDAYQQTRGALYEDANDGRARLTGAYRVGYATDYALAYWEFAHGKLKYAIDTEESNIENAHVAATVQEIHTGRFVPDLRVAATLTGPQGQALGTHELPFTWHPWLFQYGDNWRVPRTGYYRLRLRADAPTFRRYGREAGRTLARGFNVVFDSVKIVTGSK